MFSIPQDNLSYPVLVRMPKSQGTGFFLHTPSGHYFITAHHVLFKDHKLISDEIELVALATDLKESKKLHLTVNAKLLNETKKIYNPAGVDIVGFKVFSVSGIKPDGKMKLEILPGIKVLEIPVSGYTGVSHTSVKFFDEVIIGNDVILFGYPSSIGIISQPQIDYSSPLLRKGIVAGKNASKKTIIIDCPVYPGNSGGPVIQVSQVEITTISFAVIGVVSQYIPYFSETEIIKDAKPKTLESLANSGYSVVVPMDEVYSMLGIKKE